MISTTRLQKLLEARTAYKNACQLYADAVVAIWKSEGALFADKARILYLENINTFGLFYDYNGEEYSGDLTASEVIYLAHTDVPERYLVEWVLQAENKDGIGSFSKFWEEKINTVNCLQGYLTCEEFFE